MMDCDVLPCCGSKRSFTTLKQSLSQSVNFTFITDRFLKELQRLKNCKHIKPSNNPAWLPRRESQAFLLQGWCEAGSEKARLADQGAWWGQDCVKPLLLGASPQMVPGSSQMAASASDI